jgi:hypothetical protein
MDAKTVVGHTVSPAFNLAVRVENPRATSAVVRQQRGGGGLLLRQSGVALACGKSAGVLRAEEVGSGVHGSAVVQGRRGVGLPEDLRAPAPHVKNGTAQVLAEMKLYRYVRTRSF